MKDEIWNEITTSLKKGEKLELLYMRKNAQAYIIDEITEDFILIKFLNSNNPLKLDCSRFISAYKYLIQNKGEWVKIGASRKFSNPNTLEGVIKKGFGHGINNTATASWVAAILVKVFDNIKFNGKSKGQAIRLVN